jgi:hypothetical protein
VGSVITTDRYSITMVGSRRVPRVVELSAYGLQWKYLSRSRNNQAKVGHYGYQSVKCRHYGEHSLELSCRQEL